MLIMFDMTAEMFKNEKLHLIVIELLIRSRKIYISLVFSKQTYFAAPKNVTLYSTKYFFMKIPNKR